MDEQIDEALRATQGSPAPPAVPSMAELDRRVRSRQFRAAGIAGLAAVAVLALGWPRPDRGPSPAVRDAAVAEALGEVIDDLDALAQPADDALPGEFAVALLDPYAHAGDTGILSDPLSPEGEL
ncbi:MAG: hypothetical protein FJ090_12650 [Deltaproteobacteria bacterium]|nr:hypothetical protein [Deltaproteobacteria bacterium]